MQNRIIKTEDELSDIIKSAFITDEVFDLVLDYIEIGMTEKEVAKFIEQSFIKLGGERLSFDTIVAFGENGAEPHHVPCDRKLSGAEFVTVDMGTVVGGYCSDFTRTFAVGGATKEMIDVYEAVREAEKIGAGALKDGVKCFDVDKAVRDYLTEKGYGDKFVHGTGHGVGLEIHEAPTLNTKSDDVLKDNMVVTVEPGVYIEGSLGVRIENLYIVGRAEPLSRHDTKLIIIG
ncbi:xaa-Pro peptidase [Acidaminococcus sp. CAG:917]|nr:xaa-Pro peptidase [Acidaminococcus sp. CAG:917]